MLAGRLIIRSPGREDREIKISDSASIGRADDNQVCIEDTNVSRYHSIIEQRDDGFWIVDLGSINGTTVNDDQVTSERKLEDGDLIQLGGTSTLEFYGERSSARKPGGAAATTVASSDRPASGNAGSPASKSGSSAKAKAAAIAIGLIPVIILAFLLIPPGSDRDRPANGKSPGNNTNGKVAPVDPDDENADETDSGVKPTERIDYSRPPGNRGATPDISEVATRARELAILIGQRTDYEFDVAFVERIRSRIEEYRLNYEAMYANALRYRREINRAFGTDNGLQPMLGYVLAMSRSKFQEASSAKGVGPWMVPRGSAQESLPREDGAADEQQKRWADMAASYTKDLMGQFSLGEFMYAIACYDMPMTRVGEFRTSLDDQDTGARGNFWKMIQKMVQLRVVSPEAADEVVRFFAAGIVASDPKRFGLNAEPLSSLS